VCPVRTAGKGNKKRATGKVQTGCSPIMLEFGGMSDPSFSFQPSSHSCHLQRAPFLDDDQRICEITHLNGEFFLYKLHDTSHRWIGRFPNLMLAYAPTALPGFDLMRVSEVRPLY
jgi:hypothetical protein